MPDQLEETHITEDGSLTLKDEETGELYHNRAGAFTEALANFVEPMNLSSIASDKRQLAFLDVCFGLGYNTLALLNSLCELNLRAESVRVVAIEKFQKPLLYIDRVLGDDRFQMLRKSIESEAPSLMRGEFGSVRFSLQCASRAVPVRFDLLEGDLRNCIPQLVDRESGKIDGIFHDPFSPRRAPELWTIDLFECYKRMLFYPSGKIVTYSAASAVRGAFQQCGMIVRRTSAVGGKSGGTLAMLSCESFDETFGLPLFDEELEKLGGRAGVPYRDMHFCKTQREIVRAREAEQRRLFPI